MTQSIDVYSSGKIFKCAGNLALQPLLFCFVLFLLDELLTQNMLFILVGSP